MSDGAIRKKRSATDLVTLLRRDIASAKYLHGERLPPERALSEFFGVARGTVRAALEQLEAIRFVERRAGSGTYVTYTGSDRIPEVSETARPLELMDARFAFEPHICRLAILHATDRDLDMLDRLLDRMENYGGDITAFAQTDEAFHHLLARLTRNSLLEWIMKKITDVRAHAQWAQMRSLTLTPMMI